MAEVLLAERLERSDYLFAWFSAATPLVVVWQLELEGSTTRLDGEKTMRRV